MFVWCLGHVYWVISRSCLGGVSTIRWRLAIAWVVRRLCFGGLFVLFCFFVCVSVVFWWWLADVSSGDPEVVLQPRDS